MPYFWTVLTVALIALEASTSQLVSIWLAGGSFAALIASVCRLGTLWQVLIFIAVSAVLLILTRPLAHRLTAKTAEKTNVDSLVGQHGLVTESIDNIDCKGCVKLKGIAWTARSEDGSEIESGKTVTVLSVEGVKLIVKEDK